MKKVVFFLLALFFVVGNINAQKDQMHVGGQVGLSIPMGDLSDGANMGFAFQGNFLYGITQDIDLTGSLGYISWGTDVDNVSFSSVPLTFGGRYNFQRSQFTPYALAELGIHFTSSEVDIPSVSVPGFGDVGGGSVSSSGTDIGLGLGGGFVYKLDAVNIDVNAKINIVSGFNNFMIMAGVLFPIG
jgi:nucleoside-specific outer membrane channel protein Tsx